MNLRELVCELNKQRAEESKGEWISGEERHLEIDLLDAENRGDVKEIEKLQLYKKINLLNKRSVSVAIGADDPSLIEDVKNLSKLNPANKQLKIILDNILDPQEEQGEENSVSW